MEAVIVLGVIAMIIIGIAVGIAQSRAAEARRAALDQLASSLGFEYFPSGLSEPQRGFWETLTTSFKSTNTGRFLERFQGFSPFGQGHSWSISNLIVGRKAHLDWYAFDYLYKTTQSNGKTTTTVPHPTGVVAVRLGIALPRLSLAPENVFHKIGSLFGMQEIHLESEEFNKMYFIRCDDRKRAYDLLHPRMIEHLMSLPPKSWQMAGNLLVITKSGYYDPAQIVAIFEEVQGFVDLIPRYVEEDHILPLRFATPLD